MAVESGSERERTYAAMAAEACDLNVAMYRALLQDDRARLAELLARYDALLPERSWWDFVVHLRFPKVLDHVLHMARTSCARPADAVVAPSTRVTRIKLTLSAIDGWCDTLERPTDLLEALLATQPVIDALDAEGGAGVASRLPGLRDKVAGYARKLRRQGIDVSGLGEQRVTAPMVPRGTTRQASPTQAWSFRFEREGEGGGADGWVRGQAPVVLGARWPRSRVNGTPMLHLLTVLLPEEYRVHDPRFAALSLFQADDAHVPRVDGVAALFAGATVDTAGPFWDDVRAYRARPHPEEVYATDGIGGGWAWVWLTEAEFRRGEGKAPAVRRREGDDAPHGTNAWDHASPSHRFTLQHRDDPNVGYPLEDGGSWLREVDVDGELPDPWPTYVPMFSELGQHLGLDRLYQEELHLGGTCASGQGMPSCGPAYLEWTESCGGNLGGGVAQLDLKRGRISWSS